MEIEATIEKGEKIKVICPSCGGAGKHAHPVEDDEPIISECKRCNGTGKSEEIVAEDQVFYEFVDEGKILEDMEPMRPEGR